MAEQERPVSGTDAQVTQDRRPAKERSQGEDKADAAPATLEGYRSEILNAILDP